MRAEHDEQLAAARKRRRDGEITRIEVGGSVAFQRHGFEQFSVDEDVELAAGVAPGEGQTQRLRLAFLVGQLVAEPAGRMAPMAAVADAGVGALPFEEMVGFGLLLPRCDLVDRARVERQPFGFCLCRVKPVRSRFAGVEYGQYMV